jgi:hypothetical protein
MLGLPSENASWIGQKLVRGSPCTGRAITLFNAKLAQPLHENAQSTEKQVKGFQMNLHPYNENIHHIRVIIL